MSRPQACRIGMHANLWTPRWTRNAAERILPEAAEHGLEVIEISVADPDAVDAEHSRALFERYGLEPTASICLPDGFSPAINPDAATALLLKALDTAHRLGSKVLTGVFYTAINTHSGACPTTEEYDRAIAALRPVAKRARALGMSLGLEPCNRYENHLINTAAQGVEFLERLSGSHPDATDFADCGLFLHLDTFHMNIEERGVGAGFRKAGAWCSYVHLSESDRGLPGSGNVDWTDAFRAMAETGFAGYLVGEIFAPETPAYAAELSTFHDAVPSRFDVLTKGVPYLKALARQHGLL